MARLVSVATGGPQAELSSWTVVGRAPTADITVKSRLVSGHHAVVHYGEGAWRVRDLGSRNGTFIDGERLPTGQERVLRTGQRLTFGDVAFLVQDLSAPVARAVREDGQGRVEGAGLLAIPDADAPVATVHLARTGRWLLETEEGVEPVEDGAVVQIDRVGWKLSLPVGVDRTLEADRELRLEGATLTVRVSRNQERVAVVLETDGARTELESRAHSYLLFLLARQLLEEGERPPAERGWMDQTVLCAMLKIERRTLNVQVYRARKQLVQAGFIDGAQIIERRRSTEELRLGVMNVRVP